MLRTLALEVTTNIQVDLLAYYSPTDVLNFLRDTGGPVAMIYQKDALVSYAELRLTRPDLRARIRIRIQDGALQICWNSELNKLYEVQYSPALGEPWQELSSGILGNGTTNCVNTRQVSGPRFYRVVRVQ